MYRNGDRVMTRIPFDGCRRRGTVRFATETRVYVDLDYRFVESAVEIEMSNDEVDPIDDLGGGW